MLAAMLLAAVSGPVATLAPAAARESVQAVRIEVEDPDRLERFVSLVPGSPLDPEAVRRTIELMYATGEFEDVRVRIERKGGEDEVTVAIRPIPAPLLVAVRVEGDQALSPGAVRKITRLREGEPLWARRLDRAGRDVALALAARGYLEAFVESPEAVRVPGGADAVFRIRAGPRARVGSVSISGVEGLAGPSLDDLVRPKQGGVYRREEADEAAEAMRRRLARAGYWQATAEVWEKYVPAAARMILVFEVTPGPRMHVEIRGATIPGGLRGDVQDLLREGGTDRDDLEAGAERIESHLRRLGHREARVRASVEPRPDGESVVVFEAVPGPRAVAASVEIRGADAELLEDLSTRPGKPIEEAALTADQSLLTRRLQDQGHFEASVEVDAPEEGGSQPVVFLARPGPEALVVAVEVDGPPLPPSGDEEGSQELAVRVGLPYRVQDVAASREVLLSAWRRAGYLEARLEPSIELSADRTAVSVRFAVDPGARTLVENVVLAGLHHTREATVAREIVLRPGEPFSFERVLESQRRLLSLGIFERVTISELDPDRKRRRDVVVTVEEALRTTVAWGVGYSEQDLLRGSVELTRRNLSGLGRTASVFVRGSFRGSRFLLNLREPWLLGRHLDSFLTAFWEEEDRKTFDYNRKGGVAQVGQSVDSRTTLLYRYLYQDTSVFNVEVPDEEIDRQFRTYTVSGPAVSFVWDGRDDPLEPRRGTFLSSSLALSLDALGGASYFKTFVQAADIRRVRVDLAFVASLRLGLAATYGNAAPLLPLPERFFAGGAYGPRGWPVDEVGPKVVGPEGDVFPTGGNALVLGGAELRYDVTRSFQVATFFDIGNVYPEVADVSIPDLRKSVGLGVRYLTPIGPIRFDYGHKIHRLPGESAGRLHLTIGYAF
ncbi:MAG: BamA/TamA family outer membrane protein [Acidobacteria bacterium]|jgi:outer membrane protein assembly complex protein YaeT|nr:BamA/TamA family outer membrane protein [Acidobacteriota bacterium]